MDIWILVVTRLGRVLGFARVNRLDGVEAPPPLIAAARLAGGFCQQQGEGE